MTPRAIIRCCLVPATFVIITTACRGPVHAQDLVSFSTSLFAGSGNCLFCHAAGTGVLTHQGRDVSPPEGWRATMMANAARDPLWRAKVSAEAAGFPQLGAAIENKCTTCHAPMGRTQFIRDGGESYDIDGIDGDPAGMDGVSCTLCHQVGAANLGTDASFSGGFAVSGDRVIYGPYQEPLAAQMQMNVNYTPSFAAHIEDAALCGTCHTLFTAHVDAAGALTGHFPEQTPYLEWLDSAFPAEGLSCQRCHMRTVDEPMKIALRPFTLATLRSPVWEHRFVGANTLLPAILRDNAADLAVTAQGSHFAAVIGDAHSMLDAAVGITCGSAVEGDTVDIAVRVENLAGHKFPSGFPSRRAWLHVTVRDTAGGAVFESGAWDAQTRTLVHETPQPHHHTVTAQDQTQIYEAVMRGADDEPTRVLLLAASYAKDNRIPPRGFVRDIAGYDDIAIVGAAALDEDFGVDGSGADTVHYRIPRTILADGGSVDVELYYESYPAAWMEELMDSGTAAAGRFIGMYDAADRAPNRVAHLTRDIEPAGVAVGSAEMLSFRLAANHPNPFNPVTTIGFTLPDTGQVRLAVYSLTGQQVAELVDCVMDAGQHSVQWDAAGMASGMYFCVLESGGRTRTNTMVLMK